MHLARQSIRRARAHGLDLAALALFFQALSFRAGGRFGGAPHARRHGDACHHVVQALQGCLLVLILATMRLRLDDDHAVLGDALVAELEQALLQGQWQGRCADVEAQVYRAGNLVDVLPARALGANGGEFDFVFRNVGRADDGYPLRRSARRCVRRDAL